MSVLALFQVASNERAYEERERALVRHAPFRETVGDAKPEGLYATGALML